MPYINIVSQTIMLILGLPEIQQERFHKRETKIFVFKQNKDLSMTYLCQRLSHVPAVKYHVIFQIFFESESA